MHTKKIVTIFAFISGISGLIFLFDYLLKLGAFKIVISLLKLLIKLKLPDLIWIILFLLIFIVILIFNKKYKRKFRDVKIEIEKIKDEFKPSQIDREIEFKRIIKSAVQNAGFSQWRGLYGSLKDKLIYEIIKNGKRFKVVADYWSPERGANLSSEKIDNYSKEIKESDASYIIASNASGLAQKAQKTLEEFNRKSAKPKLFIIFGSDQNKFIQEFKKIIG